MSATTHYNDKKQTEEISKEEVTLRYGRKDRTSNDILVVKIDRVETKTAVSVSPAKMQKKTSEDTFVEIPVVKEFLTAQSSVLKKMFTPNTSKKASKCKVQLPVETLSTVIDMLDYLYPSRQLTINDQNAAALLPLAHKYEIGGLKSLCVNELKKFAKPRLEYVSLAIRFDLEDFLPAAIDVCAQRLSVKDIDNQQKETQNREVDDSILLKILRKKSDNTKEYMHSMILESLRTISNGRRPTYTPDRKVCDGFQIIWNNNCDMGCTGYNTRNESQNAVATLMNMIDQDCYRNL